MTLPAMSESPTGEQGPSDENDVAVPSTEQQLRAGAWSLLANVLRQSPDQATLDYLMQLGDGDSMDGDDLVTVMQMLGLAARNTRPDQVDSEFHTLFVGLGRGELVPFGSWYLTGFLMETPLVRLREDLKRLGYQRQAGVGEPEDHIAALAEVMAVLILDDIGHATQQAFFTDHIAPWAGRFFKDLSESQSAVLYRAIGRFGEAFCEFENRYLSMGV